MSRTGLLRRAAAATLGAGPHRPGTTTLVARELPLPRRAAAAVLGIRSHPARAPHPAGSNTPAPVRVWEVRRPRPRRPSTTVPTAGEDDAARHAFLPPTPRRRTPPTPAADAAEAAEATEPPTVIISAGDDATTPSPRPRTWLALAATAAVLATALGVLAYHHTRPDHTQPPSRVTTGDVPPPFVGTWSATITNADGDNTRTLVIKQGRIGDTVMTLTADGPTDTAPDTASPKSSAPVATTNAPATGSSYHCVFQAALTAAASTSLRLGASTVAAGDPGYCKPGGPTTLTLKTRNTLQRATDSNGESLTYTRTP